MKKNHKFILTFLFAVTFMSLSLFPQRVMANEIRVFLDGVELNYTYVQPHIINERTMVPLTETAAHFNMEFTWDPQTATMVFTSPGRTMAHTVFTDTVFINGEETRFDVPSMVANDRTLMPIRMLAFAIGIEDDGIDWDPSGIVDLWRRPSGSTANNNQNQTAENPFANVGAGQTGETPGAAAGNPAIISASVGRINHDQGTPIVILVETNRAADRVRVTDFDGAVLSELTEFEEDFQGRYFRISVTLEDIGEKTLRVQAGGANGYAIGASNITVNIVPSTPERGAISNLTLARSTIDLRSTSENNTMVEGTVRTNTNVTHIEVNGSEGNRRTRVTRPAHTFPTFLTWEFSFNSNSRSGEHIYTIVAVDDNNNNEELNFTINVVSGTGDSNQNRIQSASLRDGNALMEGRWHYITVITNDRVDRVEIRDRNSADLGRDNGHRDLSSNRREWEFEFRADETSANNYWIYVREDGSWSSRRLNELISSLRID